MLGRPLPHVLPFSDQPDGLGVRWLGIVSEARAGGAELTYPQELCTRHVVLNPLGVVQVVWALAGD